MLDKKILVQLDRAIDVTGRADLRGAYFGRKLIFSGEGRDFTGAVLYRCYPSGLKCAIEIDPLTESEARTQLNDLCGIDLRGVDFRGVDMRTAFQGVSVDWETKGLYLCELCNAADTDDSMRSLDDGYIACEDCYSQCSACQGRYPNEDFEEGSDGKMYHSTCFDECGNCGRYIRSEDMWEHRQNCADSSDDDSWDY